MSEAPETEARNMLINGLEEAYAGLGFVIRDDKIHASLGDQETIIGVYPVRTRAWPRDILVNEMEIMVQFYGKYDLKVEPEQTVSPSTVEGNLQLFREWIKVHKDGPSNAVWFYEMTDVKFPDDPTGNKSRYEATIIAKGNNPTWLETS